MSSGKSSRTNYDEEWIAESGAYAGMGVFLLLTLILAIVIGWILWGLHRGGFWMFGWWSIPFVAVAIAAVIVFIAWS